MKLGEPYPGKVESTGSAMPKSLSRGKAWQAKTTYKYDGGSTSTSKHKSDGQTFDSVHVATMHMVKGVGMVRSEHVDGDGKTMVHRLVGFDMP